MEENLAADDNYRGGTYYSWGFKQFDNNFFNSCYDSCAHVYHPHIGARDTTHCCSCEYISKGGDKEGKANLEKSKIRKSLCKKKGTQ